MQIDREQIEVKYKDIIQAAIDIMSSIDDPEHGLGHIYDVVDNIVRIIERLPDDAENTDSELDAEMCVVCAYWHDVGRRHKGAGHEVLSAEMLVEVLIDKGFDENYIEKCKESIVNHKWDASKPETFEGVILREADKLAFIGARRWKECLEKGYKLVDIVRLLPSLRNEILRLEITRQLYDIDIVESFKNLYSLWGERNDT